VGAGLTTRIRYQAQLIGNTHTDIRRTKVVLQFLRAMVFALFVWSALVALGSWAVRTRRISPFGFAGQRIRRLTDPVLKPTERWLLQRGGNPQNAGWLLLGASIIGGIIVVTFSEWVVVQAIRVTAAGASGPRSLIRLLLYYAAELITIALIVRVIGSWFGADRHRRWMRTAYALTDWIVSPLRRFVPPIGMIDITPIVAWFLIQFLVLPLLMGVL
jgi:YggT family protein